MPADHLTLKDPLNLIPPLLLRCFAEGYSRGFIQTVKADELSATGLPIITGRYQGDRYTWDITVKLPEDLYLHFLAMLAAQQKRYADLQDGAIEFVDEFEPLVPMTPQRPIVPGSARTIAGLPTGFGVHRVFLQIDEKFSEHAGVTHQGQIWKTLTFKAIEV